MKKIACKQEDLAEMIKNLVLNVREPLYRGLGHLATQDYQREGLLLCYDGELAVGSGVFFTNRWEEAFYFAKSGLMVVSSRDLLDSRGEVIDERVNGYDLVAKNKLDLELGVGNYNGYRLWAEIQKKDTITRSSLNGDTYTYTKRKPVTKEELIAEIMFKSLA